MKRSKLASELFHPVDPELHIIDRGHRRKGTLTQKDWGISGGAFCPGCHQEVVRFVPENGLCASCDQELIKKQDRDDKKRAKQLRLIKQHNARIDRRRRLM